MNVCNMLRECKVNIQKSAAFLHISKGENWKTKLKKLPITVTSKSKKHTSINLTKNVQCSEPKIKEGLIKGPDIPEDSMLRCQFSPK